MLPSIGTAAPAAPDSGASGRRFRRTTENEMPILTRPAGAKTSAVGWPAHSEVPNWGLALRLLRCVAQHPQYRSHKPRMRSVMPMDVWWAEGEGWLLEYALEGADALLFRVRIGPGQGLQVDAVARIEIQGDAVTTDPVFMLASQPFIRTAALGRPNK